MPSRQVVSKELSEIFKVLAHPDRVRIIEELGAGERDVTAIVEQLELPGPRVSQHLSLMKAHRIVEERRDGRHHYYRLIQPQIAKWIIEGLDFVEGRLLSVDPTAVESARKLWSSRTT